MIGARQMRAEQPGLNCDMISEYDKVISFRRQRHANHASINVEPIVIRSSRGIAPVYPPTLSQLHLIGRYTRIPCSCKKAANYQALFEPWLGCRLEMFTGLKLAICSEGIVTSIIWAGSEGKAESSARPTFTA